MAERPPSLQEIIRRRQRGDFVGRERHRTAFRENFGLAHADRKFVFSVHGQAGIGKTFLLRQLRTIATETGSLVAVTDDNELDLVTTMVAVAHQLADQGGQARSFTQRYERYQSRQDELLMDPDAPSAAKELLTSATVRMAVGAVKTAVPGLGFVADAFTPEDIAARVESSRGFLSRKFKNHADVRLMLSPVEELTPLFVDDLRELCRHRPVVLMFDTFERTSSVLEQWMLRTLSEQYGELPANLTLVIVGQQPLDRNRWGDYATVIEDWALEPFTDAEARALLERRGVRDERVVEVILGLSGGLPLLVAMLAEQGPRDPDEIGDPSGSAVDRFLKWESDPRHREDALLGALPRSLDEDVLAVLVGRERAGEVLERLRGLPFVTEQNGRPQYHQVVREQMIRRQRTRSPQRFAERHRALADFYAEAATRINVPERDQWASESWRECTLEQHYHLLCTDARGSRPEVLEGAARAAVGGVVSVRRWASMIGQAGRAADVESLRSWATRLSSSVEDQESFVHYLTLILNEGGLTGGRRGNVLRRRAVARIKAGEFEQAKSDLDAALELNPGDFASLSFRGEVHRRKGDFAKAVADLTVYLDTHPDSVDDLAERGVAYSGLGQLDAAVSDLERVLTSDPTYRWASTHLASVHSERGDHRAAKGVLDRAIEAAPDDAFLHTERGWTALGEQDTERGMADFDRALELAPRSGKTWFRRGHARLTIDDLAGAQADFDEALHLDPEDDWTWSWRAELHRRCDRFDAALSDLTEAIRLDPEYADYYVWRAIVHRLRGEHTDALADADRALERGQDHHFALLQRALAHQALDEVDAALADLTASIDAQPDQEVAYWFRMLLHLDRGDLARARSDADLLLDRDPDTASYYQKRADILVLDGDVTGALADANKACELDESPVHRVLRGEVLFAANDLTGAAAEFHAALQLTAPPPVGSSSWKYHMLGLVAHMQHDADGAAAYARQALEAGLAECRDPLADSADEFNLAVYRLALGEYDEARASVERILERRTLLEDRVAFRRDLEQLRAVVPRHSEAIDAVLSRLSDSS